MKYQILHEYIENSVTAISRAYPDQDIETIRRFVKDSCRARFESIDAKVLLYPECGVEEETTMPLLDYIDKTKPYVITPRGTAFKRADCQSSHLRKNVEKKKALRKRDKNAMLEYESKGDLANASLKDGEQLGRKANVNSIFGNAGSPYSFLYDLACFNSITSMARACIILGYSHTERLLQGSYYVPTEDHVINYITYNIRFCPSEEKILGLIEKYDLHFPTPEDVYNMFNYNYQKYTFRDLSPAVEDLINNLRGHERAFIYYAGNLKSLVIGNEDKFKPWINNFYVDFSSVDIEGIKPEDIYKEDEDLLILIGVNYAKEFNMEYFYNLPKSNPEAARRVVGVARAMTEKLNALSDLFNTFINVESEFHYIIDHKNIQRETVVGSDTDSVIFTTKNWIEWYTGKTILDKDAYKVNSLVVYWLTKSIIKVLDILCRNRNVTEEDSPRLYMKNEFLYETYFSSPIKKHYYGLQIVKEGRHLPKPKVDIKGLQYKNSTLPYITCRVSKQLLHDTMVDLGKNGILETSSYIARALDYEQVVFKSLYRGRLEYVPVMSVKSEEEYADANKSIYFNYSMWQGLFAEKYGDVQLSNKNPIIPLVSLTPKNIEQYIKDKDLCAKFKELMLHHGKKELKRLPLPANLSKIPEELRDLMDIRKIVLRNMAPFKLILSSQGVSFPEKNDDSTELLFCDMYPRDEMIIELKAV